MKLLLSFALAALIAFAPPAFATAQAADRLLLDGEQVSLHTNPLAPLIENGRIVLPEPAEVWSSNWRGYVATWSISDGRLLLTKLEILLRPEGADDDAKAAPVDVLPRLFEGKTSVPAEWFSGTLIIPRGKLLNYVHMGYGSTYEHYTILDLSHGQVAARKDLDATEFERLRKERFAAYQRTAEYQTRLEEAREDMSRREARAFLYEFAVEEYMSAAP